MNRIQKLGEDENQNANACQNGTGPGGILYGIQNNSLLTGAGEEADHTLQKIAEDGGHTVQCIAGSLLGLLCVSTGGIATATAESRAVGELSTTFGTEHTVTSKKFIFSF